MRWAGRIRWDAVGLTVVVVAGVIARSWQLDYSFDKDEIGSILVAGGNFSHLWAAALRDAPHPPLYYASLHVWLSLFGVSEWSARAFSIALSVAFMVVVYKILRRYVETPWALATLCIFAFGSYFVCYGQLVRPYSLIALAWTFNFLAFLRALDAPDSRRAIGIWAVSCVVLVYSQYLGVLYIGAQIAYALYRLRVKGMRFALCGAAAVLTVVPWLLAATGPAIQSHADPLPTIDWITRPGAADFAWFYALLFGTLVPLRWLVLVTGVLALLYARSIVRAGVVPKEHGLLALLAVGVPLLVLALSIWGPRPVFVARQLMGAAIACVVFIGVFLAAVPKPFAAAGAALLIGFCIFSLPAALPDNQNEPWRQVAEWVDHAKGPVRVVVANRQDHYSLAYYSKAANVRLLYSISPAENASSFVIVCRPATCWPSGAEYIHARARVVRTWHWDRYNGVKPTNVLLAYVVRAASRPRTARLGDI